ncbi:MAG: MoaD/ThiS family protein [Desulfurococcales archaeon]|nr:MoaD/ThiS family protein [Desulfurococcales archaeon]
MAKARVIPDNKELTVDSGISVEELLKAAGFNTESAVVLVNGSPVPEDYRVKEGDEIVIVRVLSGG